MLSRAFVDSVLPAQDDVGARVTQHNRGRLRKARCQSGAIAARSARRDAAAVYRGYSCPNSRHVRDHDIKHRLGVDRFHRHVLVSDLGWGNPRGSIRSVRLC